MLAEITSQDENAFVKSKIPRSGYCKYIQNADVTATSPHAEEQDKTSNEV